MILTGSVFKILLENFTVVWFTFFGEILQAVSNTTKAMTFIIEEAGVIGVNIKGALLKAMLGFPGCGLTVNFGGFRVLFVSSADE